MCMIVFIHYLIMSIILVDEYLVFKLINYALLSLYLLIEVLSLRLLMLVVNALIIKGRSKLIRPLWSLYIF